MADLRPGEILSRYPLEPLFGMALGVLFGWGLFGAGMGALIGYFLRVLRRQFFEDAVPGGGEDSSEKGTGGNPEGAEAALEAYRVLGVDPESSTAEIRRVYRSLAASFHPDGMASLTEEQRREAEQAFVRVRGAWETVARLRGERP